jgi:alkanesulfonate monooxygenase SsuD/methylene tetrahydromethanopterin reductase-like flavin-dependent oxidoreductase (luciferase family)
MFQPKPVQKPRVPIWIGSMKLKAPMMEETIARYADGTDIDNLETIKDLLKKKERIKKMCQKIGRDFKQLKWSVSNTVGVIGEDTDDFKERMKEITEQQWIWSGDAPKPAKQKYLETLNTKQIGGTTPEVIEKLSQFKDHVDIINICLPFIGNLRQNGLDTIKILKERILGKL